MFVTTGIFWDKTCLILVGFILKLIYFNLKSNRFFCFKMILIFGFSYWFLEVDFLWFRLQPAFLKSPGSTGSKSTSLSRPSPKTSPADRYPFILSVGLTFQSLLLIQQLVRKIAKQKTWSLFFFSRQRGESPQRGVRGSQVFFPKQLLSLTADPVNSKESPMRLPPRSGRGSTGALGGVESVNPGSWDMKGEGKATPKAWRRSSVSMFWIENSYQLILFMWFVIHDIWTGSLSSRSSAQAICNIGHRSAFGDTDSWLRWWMWRWVNQPSSTTLHLHSMWRAINEFKDLDSNCKRSIGIFREYD